MSQKYEGNGKWTYTGADTGRRDVATTSSSSASTSSSAPDITDSSNKETTTSSDQAVKEYTDVEDNVLVGDLNVIPDPKYKAKTTVLLQYLGKNLTGLYFVDKVTHVFGQSGYAQSLSVSRNGFGSTIKSGSVNKPVSKVAPTTSKATTSKAVVTPKVSARYHTVVSGDSLWAIASKYYGNGAQYNKIFNANTNIIKNASLIYPGQKLLIP